MNKQKIWFFSSLTLTLSAIILLVTSASLLTLSLNKNNTIPLGTFITWIGLISLPLTIYWSVKELRKPTTKLNSILSGSLKTIIVLGILWTPLSYLLAGNFSFVFSEKETFQGGQTAMKLFWRLSYGIVIGSILSILSYWISLLFKVKTNLKNEKHI